MYVLNPVCAGDRHFVKKGLSDPKVYKHYGVRLTNDQKVEEQMQWYANLETQKDGQWWIIRKSHSNEEIGAIGIHDINKLKDKAELGFWLIPEFWGLKIISNCFPLFLEELKSKWALKSLIAFVETEHFKSKKLLLNCGFIYVETLYKIEEKDGVLIDLDVFECYLK